eukprot:Rmarinus@m.3456
MTLFHFVNCVLLTFGPAFVVYNATSLAEYRAFGLCVRSGMLCCVTTLAKLLLLATFVPTSEEADYSLSLEVMKSSILVVDLIGMSMALRTKGFRSGPLKALGVGLGWWFAECGMTTLMPLWFGARGMEASWEYVVMALQSNLALVERISLASLVSLALRKDGLHQQQLAVAASVHVTIPVLCSYIRGAMDLDAFSQIAAETSITAFVALFALSRNRSSAD